MKNLGRAILLSSFGLLASQAASAACTEHYASNYTHQQAGRATMCNSYYTCAVGSGENMGLWNTYTYTTLKEEPAGNYAIGNCSASTGSAPVASTSFGIQDNAPFYTLVGAEISDADGDLQSVDTVVTNDRNSNVQTANCFFALVNGTSDQYETTSCASVEINTWGNYEFKVKGTDAQANVGESDSVTLQIKTGSSIPSMSISNYSVQGTNLVVTGTGSDADGDLEAVTIGAGFLGYPCTGTTSYSCSFDFSEIAAGTLMEIQIIGRDSVDNYNDLNADASVIYFTVPESATCETSSNSAHYAAGRAIKYGFYYYAKGTLDYLGLSTQTTSLEQVNATTWDKVTSCN